jgi:hypothetical protein
MPLSASPCEQLICAVRPLPQHFSSEIVPPDKLPQRASILTAYGLACTNGFPLESCGPEPSRKLGLGEAGWEGSTTGSGVVIL